MAKAQRGRDGPLRQIPAITSSVGAEETLSDKGRGNGYVLTTERWRFYFSGDTRYPGDARLKNIDVAFVMHESALHHAARRAADAVKAFTRRS